MQFRLGVALLLLPSTIIAQPPAPVQSALLGVALPDSTSVSKSILYRVAAQESLKLDATREGVTLGSRLEMFRLPMSGPTQADIVASMQRAGWTVRMDAAAPTVGVADKAGAPSVLVSFVSGNKDRWLYTADITPRAGTVVATQQTTPAVVPKPATTPTPTPAAAPSTFAFSTTKFDDGWTSVIGDSYTKVTKGDLRVVLHYKREEENKYMSVLSEQTTLFWNLLVAPRYRDVANVFIERNNPGGYEPVNVASATATEIETGRRVYIVLFNHANRNTHWMEFVTPDKATFEREFGPYLENSTAWPRWIAMAGRNRFAVAPSDFSGTWSDNFASGTSMVYAATGRAAGMMYAGGNTTVTFDGGSYVMDVAGATGMVGNIRTQNVTYKGAFSVVDNWTIAFDNNFQGRTRRFKASFEGVPGGRILNLVLDEAGAGITLHMVRVR